MEREKDDKDCGELRQCSLHIRFILCNNNIKIMDDIKNTLLPKNIVFRSVGACVHGYAISVHFHLISFLQICLQ